ncbi:carbohydrate-binding module family 18 [Aspergillus desertorum]
MGPDYCGADVCINNCDAKAECNPGSWPSEYVNATTCPLDVCCSPYGFCGTTEEFCGNKTVAVPSCDASSQSITRVIGYYNSAGATRGCDGMAPYSVPQGVYSHIYFAFGSIDPDSFEVIPAQQSDETLYQQLAALQYRDAGQELWISIGGWDFSDSEQPTATTFSDLVGADSDQQSIFFTTLLNFMNTWGFTGVDIDWEYPVADDRNGRAEDYENYPAFLASLKSALSEYNYGLSITLPTSYWYLQHFDLKSIEPSVDWFNFMAYDLHGTWDIGDEWTGPYLDAHTNLTEIKSALDLLWRVDISPSKVNLGLAFYGRSYTMASGACSEPGCEYLSAGTAGTCSDSAGILFNSEIEDIIQQNSLNATLYEDAAVKIITWDTDQWVSFDDGDTWKLKADYAKSICLGGVLVWAIDEDDDTHTFSNGLAAALGNPVNVNSTTGLSLTLSKAETSTTTTTSSQDSVCRFINCGETCPTGFKEIPREDKTSQIMLDSTECLTGGGQTQTLCCPTSEDLPTCRWRGFHNNGKCKGGCNSDEAEVGTITSGCSSGYQSACCTITNSTQPWADCAWTSSCESDDTCPSGYDQFVVGSRQGWGGRSSCSGSKNYNYCCKSSIPDAFTNCAWTGHVVSFTNAEYCTDACPSGSIRIAEEEISVYMGGNKPGKADNCYFGNEAYCCNGTTTTITTTPPRADPLEDATAYEFHYYLGQWLADPVCFANEDAEYSATFQRRATTSDQALVFTTLVQILAVWMTSSTPRADLDTDFNAQLADYGLLGESANLTTFRGLFYGVGTWTGSPTYDPDSMISEWLCNIAESQNAVAALGDADSALCMQSDLVTKRSLPEVDIPEVDSLEVDKRHLDQSSTDARNSANTQPTVAQALRGVTSGDLTLHYARWIRGTNRPEVILETAFWIGPEPGTAPTQEMLAVYGDTGDTAASDLWIVFHMHITLDDRTFLNTQRTNGNFYPGVASMQVYHSQTLTTVPGANSAPRAQFRFSSTYDQSGTTWNTGPMANYNSRMHAITCRDSATRRWYIGQDDTRRVQGLSRFSQPYAQELNDFGVFLFNQGLFSNGNLGLIWPAIASYTADNRPNNVQINGRGAYRPSQFAFTTNWNYAGDTSTMHPRYSEFHTPHPDFTHPGIANPPAFHDLDGSPVYEAPYGALLHTILASNDVAALTQYSATSPVLYTHYEIETDNPFYIAAENHSFDVVKALVAIWHERGAVSRPGNVIREGETKTLNAYLDRHHVSLIEAGCRVADRGFVAWLLDQEPPLGRLTGELVGDGNDDYRPPLWTAAAALRAPWMPREGEDAKADSGGMQVKRTEDAEEESARHEAFVYWLLEQGCSVTESDVLWPRSRVEGRPPAEAEEEMQLYSSVLGAAVRGASRELVARLIAKGADPHARQMFCDSETGAVATGVTPLHIASLFWNHGAVRALLEHGGDIEPAEMVAVADSQGRLPLHLAVMGPPWIGRKSGLGSIATEMMLDTVTLLLEANPATVNVPDQEDLTPASHAISSHTPGRHGLLTRLTSLLRILITHGADVCSRDGQGRNLLHQLTSTQWVDPLEPALLDLLLDQPGMDINSTAKEDGNTALHNLARHLDQIDAIRYLLRRGADVNAINHEGNTPLHEAMKGNTLLRQDSRGFLEPRNWEHTKQVRDAVIRVLVDAGGSMEKRNAAGQTPGQIREDMEMQKIAGRGRGRP